MGPNSENPSELSTVLIGVKIVLTAAAIGASEIFGTPSNATVQIGSIPTVHRNTKDVKTRFAALALINCSKGEKLRMTSCEMTNGKVLTLA